MIEITIDNFRGCAHARIEVAPIALCCGLNAAGKSSVAQAVGAALTGEAMVAKGMGGHLVRTGAAGGSVTVSHTDGSARVEWPAGTMTTAGTAPTSSVYAAGIESIANGAARDRIRVLSDYLRAMPTREDLERALAEAGAGPSTAGAVWDLIEREGSWDNAHAKRREFGAELKGRWRQTTGANYGSRIAASWRPDLAELVEADLISDFRQAQVARDNAVSAAAVSASEKARLEGIAGELQTHKAEVARCERQVEAAATDYTRALEARSKLPPAARSQTKRCPHCNQLIEVLMVTSHEVELKQAVEVTGNGAEKRRMAIAEADGKTAHANDKLNEARSMLTRAKLELADAIAANATLADWPAAVETGTDRAAAEAALDRASRRLSDYQTKIEADKIAGRIEGNEILLGILGAEGLRARKLGNVLRVFNEALDAHCQQAGWSTVAVDEAGMLTYGARPYALASTSEQFRVRVVLALAMAEVDGSDLVVIDGADILDAPGRNQLFELLAACRVKHALVCMTLARIEQVPDLGKLGLGHSYWLRGAVVEPVGEFAAA